MFSNYKSETSCYPDACEFLGLWMCVCDRMHEILRQEHGLNGDIMMYNPKNNNLLAFFACNKNVSSSLNSYKKNGVSFEKFSYSLLN